MKTKKRKKSTNFIVKKWAPPTIIAVIAVILAFILVPANAQIVDLLGGNNTTAEKASWSAKKVELPNGRIYFALMPTCDGGCKQARQVFVFTHGVGGPEDMLNASNQLKSLHNVVPNAIYAYSVSKDGTKRFDVGTEYCCTWTDTQEVQYLIDVVSDITSKTPVDRSQVGLLGKSNGGMLSERAVCTRPDVFEAAASWAGTWTTRYEGCQHGRVSIEQWHGDKDTVVRLEGGCTPIDGHNVCYPPATELGTKITSDSNFELHIIPGEDHNPAGWIVNDMAKWLSQEVAY